MSKSNSPKNPIIAKLRWIFTPNAVRAEFRKELRTELARRRAPRYTF